MPTYSRETRIAAPLDAVWAFHAEIEGLEKLTPDWLHLRVEAVHGPEEQPDPDELVEGTAIRMSIRPFGVGPRQRWTSRILDRETPPGAAYFVDSMENGPFRHWEHTHSFYADGDETILRDRVEYRLPFGALGDAVGPVAKVGFEGMFRQRHARTKELLEGDGGVDGGVNGD
ncbi:SRPBCC family protein [Haloparvum sp. AD34]